MVCPNYFFMGSPVVPRFVNYSFFRTVSSGYAMPKVFISRAECPGYEAL